MMNALALCLVFSSLVTAGVWSPNPVKKNPTEDDVTVKDVHKVIVVEVDKEDGNTKVSISSQEADLSHKPQIVGYKKYMSDAKKKLSTATKDAVEVAQEKVEEASSTNGHGHSPGELACNALGKCKHKVSEKAQEVKEHVQEAVTEVLGKAKEAVAQKTGDISDKAREVQEEAKNAVRGASESVKETASVKAQRIGSGAKEAVRGASEKGKETASVISRVVEESTKAMASKAKHGAETVLGTSKTVGKERATEAEQEAGEMAEEGSETVKSGANRQREGGEKELSEIFRRGREVAYDGLWYLASERTVGPLLGVIHLLGFATAYGMCMWVTFVSSYVLAAAMARQQFGVVQSKIYPVYFRAMAYSVTVALVGHLLGQRKRVLEDPAEMFQLYTLLASILLLLFNLLYLEPLATKVMFERMKLEKEEGRGKEDLVSEPSSEEVAAKPVAKSPSTLPTGTETAPTPPIMPEKPEQEAALIHLQIVELSERLKRLNAHSSFLNILTLMVLSWHLVYLGHHLHHVAC